MYTIFQNAASTITKYSKPNILKPQSQKPRDQLVTTWQAPVTIGKNADSLTGYRAVAGPQPVTTP